jgi:ParB family transcriptional regulator, chromosome partitioning protein
MSKSALGRGLGALLGGSPAIPAASAPPTPGVAEAAATEKVLTIPLSRIQASALQPRKEFPANALKELADSIREKGILQPLLVRPRGSEYELIAGERRWRAAQMVGLKEAPALVRQVDDHSALEIMLIENLQRENLNAIDEAQGYEQLMTQFNLRQEDIATRVGKNRATVANSLRLLKLDPEVQAWVRHDQLSVGHAKAILGLALPAEQKLAAEAILKKGLSVRAAEELVAGWSAHREHQLSAASAGGGAKPPRDLHVADLETRLQQRLATKVQLRYRKGKGSMTIHFYNDDELERLLEIISVKVD